MCGYFNHSSSAQAKLLGALLWAWSLGLCAILTVALLVLVAMKAVKLALRLFNSICLVGKSLVVLWADNGEWWKCVAMISCCARQTTGVNFDWRSDYSVKVGAARCRSLCFHASLLYAAAN